MLNCVIDTTTQYVNANQLNKSVGEWLASIWAACFQALNNSKKKHTATGNNNNYWDSFFLKVMVVSIILYDHIDPNGAFSKASPINVNQRTKNINWWIETNIHL